MTHDIPHDLSMAWILYFNRICFYIILLWFSKWISDFSFHSLKLYLHAKINIFSSLSPSFSHRHTYMNAHMHPLIHHIHAHNFNIVCTYTSFMSVFKYDVLWKVSFGKSPLITYMAISSHCKLQSVFTVIIVFTIG